MGIKGIDFQQTAIGFLAGLVLMGLLLIVPVSAGAGEIVAWGQDDYGQATAPPDSRYIQVSAGYHHSLALRQDGTIVAWGRDVYGLTAPQPGSSYTQVSAGYYHNLALREDGTMVAWGNNNFGQATAQPGSGYIQVSAGCYHNLALREDGTMVAWGYNRDGQATALPGSNYTQVSAGRYHNLALREDGTMVAWGRNNYGQATALPGSNYTQVSAGCFHSLALREDGTIVAWGRDDDGQATPQPGSSYTQVSAGRYHNLALREDGTMVAWGQNDDGQATPQPGYGYTQVEAGCSHNLAIKTLTRAPFASISAESSCNEGSEICFDASGSLNTNGATTYRWTFGDGESSSGVTVGHTYADNGEYEVILTVTNPDGKSDTAITTISVANVAPVIESLSIPDSESVGTAVGALALFSDPGQDTHTATWDWGDQTGSDITGNVDEDTGEVTGSHIYTTPGNYQIALTVIDNNGGAATRSTMIVITDEEPGEPPGPVNTPEFPTIVVPSILIISLSGVLLLARRRE